MACPVRPVHAQEAAAGQGAASVARGLDLESAGKVREAIVEYRSALGATDQVVAAVLGLERCYAQLGRGEQLLPLLDTLLARRPDHPTLRTVQLRTLTSVGRDDDARQAFENWSALAPNDPTPYREYARLLLDDGHTLAADTVLREATRVLGTTRELATELAQLRAALGLWPAAAKSWRAAMAAQPYLTQAAIFSLSQAPAAARDSVRAGLLEPPVELLSRQVLAGLELRWRSPRAGWKALSELQPTDSVRQAWLEFAADAEADEAWLVARDAYAAALRAGAPRQLALRAANAALQGGEPASVLDLLALAGPSLGDSAAGSVTLLQVRALAELARPQAAESTLAARGDRLDPEARDQAMRALAWGWVRVGDLRAARAALSKAGGEAQDRATPWIALYEGDLETARAGLRHADEATRDAVLAMAFLSRTRADSSVAAGQAFLALARSDTASAAKTFEGVAGEITEAAPFALGVAARLYVAAGDTTKSLALWQTLVASHASAPEAAEAELEWARVLRQRGDSAGAAQHLEHMILTWPQSALVPQARRELEMVKGAVRPEG
jgi:hypothetical protein